jgi:hypothetical protein
MKKLMVVFFVFMAAVIIIPAGAAEHTIQWQNHCSYPVWVDIQGGLQYTVPGSNSPSGKDTTYGACSCLFDKNAKPFGCNPTTKCDQSVCGPNREFKCDQGTPLVDGGGFRLDAAQGAQTTHTSVVSEKWQGGFWGRTGCTGTDDNLDCGWQTCRAYTDNQGKTQCGGAGVTPPATKGEINFDQGGYDTYDVSIVDGFNVPMAIEIVPGTGKTGSLPPDHKKFDCTLAGTKTDLLPLFNATGLNFNRLIKISDGKMMAMWSACSATSPPNPVDPRKDEYCCIDPWGSKQNYQNNGNKKCDPTTWPADMNTASFFHTYLIGSYSYAYDDDAATFQCMNADSDTFTSYIVTFCGANEDARINLPGSDTHTHVPVLSPTPVPTSAPLPVKTAAPVQTPVPTAPYNPVTSGQSNY